MFTRTRVGTNGHVATAEERFLRYKKNLHQQLISAMDQRYWGGRLELSGRRFWHQIGHSNDQGPAADKQCAHHEQAERDDTDGKYEIARDTRPH